MKTLNIEGYIIPADDRWIYDMFGITVMTQHDMRDFLKSAGGDDIELRIDCMGGDVWIASDIYSDLRDYKGNSTATIIGLSASASTIMMLGCNKVVASPTAQFMFHNAQTNAEGDYRDMEQAAKMLKDVNETIINAYEVKTGMDRKDLAAIMDNTTWMAAQEALKHGFVDEISLKKGEVLSDIQISAVMAMSSRAYNAASISTAKMHEYAKKFKVAEEIEITTLGGTPKFIKGPSKETYRAALPEPVAILQNQNEHFNKIKLKLLEVN